MRANTTAIVTKALHVDRPIRATRLLPPRLNVVDPNTAVYRVRLKRRKTTAEINITALEQKTSLHVLFEGGLPSTKRQSYYYYYHYYYYSYYRFEQEYAFLVSRK